MVPQTTTHFFSFDAISLISIEAKHQDTPEKFFEVVDEIADQKRYLKRLPTDIEWSGSLVLGNEYANAVQVFEDIGPRNLVFASDPRLWIYLSFVTHRSFMEERWPLEDYYPSRAKDRWLMSNTKARDLVRHGIARLWWITYLTLDDELQFPLSQRTGNPYAYCEWMLANDDRRKYLFEGIIGRTPRVKWALMQALTESPETLHSADIARKLAKRINLEAGFRNLQALGDAELLDLVRRELDSLLDSQKSTEMFLF